MFDFAGYAREKGIAIAIDPYGEHTLLTVSPSLEMGKDYTKLECCVRAGLVEGQEQEILDRCVARLRAIDTKHASRIRESQKRAEMEKFWRNR